MVASPIVLVRRVLGSPYETFQQLTAFILRIPHFLAKKEAEICTSVLLWVLGTFKDLQDALLAVGLIRSYALAAFEQEYLEACKGALRKPRRSWDDLPYVTSDEARQIIFHATIRTLAHTGTGSRDCILLQTGLDKTGRFQEAVGEAIAKAFKAGLLVVDEPLLGRIANQVLGSSLDYDQDVGLLRFILSCFISGGKEAFVWGAVQRVALKQKGLVALFITDADQTLCRSQERYSAFRATFMGPDSSEAVPRGLAGYAAGTAPVTAAQVERARLPKASPARIVILGGTSLGDLNVPPPSSSDDKGSAPDPAASAGEGEDFPIPPSVMAAAAAAELGLAGSANKKDEFDVRIAMGKLFSIMVKLEAPRSGPGSKRHWEQLQKDSQDLLAQGNHRHLASLLPSTTTIPDTSCSVYRDRALSASDWEKVLGWARFMQIILNREARLKQQQHKLQEVPEAEAPAQPSQQQASPGTERKLQPIRRSRSASSSRGFSVPLLESLLGSSPTKAIAKKAAVLPAALTNGCGAVAPPPGDLSSPRVSDLAALDAGKQAQYLQPSCQHTEPSSSNGSGLEGCTASSIEVDGLQTLSSLPHASEEQVAGHPHAALAVAVIHGAGRSMPSSPGKPLKEVSERALRYGLSMVRKAGGGLRPHIQASNSYEKRLLSEVVHPDDSGTGFAEVGALDKAKDVLREVVQLPLQQPALFAQGSLARPTKGILLFGPPGTGKTLLAKATAAECGASFLAISPSVLMSKWVGESVRVVRACFSLAAKLAPCVLFLDEVDAMLSRRRADGESDYLREVKNEFMAQWDGIRGRGLSGDRVIVLGATNRPQDLDEAVLRRFQRRIFCDLPSAKGRSAILEVLLANELLDEDVSFARLAEKTSRFSGSDLRALCTSAAMRPVRELLEASGKSAKIAAERKRKAATQPFSLADHAAAVLEPLPPAAHGTSATGDSSLNSNSRNAAEQGQQQHEQSETPDGTISEPQHSSPIDCPEKQLNHAAARTAEQGISGAHLSLLPALKSQTEENETSEDLHCNGCRDDASTESSPPEDGPPSSDIPPADSRNPQQPGVEPAAGANPKAAVQERQQRLMQCLIEGCDDLADDHQQASAKLRPIKMDDFEKALKDVVPTVSSESMVIEELKQWAAKFGEGGNRNAQINSLTYFI